jgi:FlaA1/EpsC-like NDP-sugar epimerase
MSGGVGIAVIGAGGWGKNLIRNFAQLPNVSLRYICDRDEQALNRVTAHFPAAKAVADFDAVLADPQVAAVAIATPGPPTTTWRAGRWPPARTFSSRSLTCCPPRTPAS